MVPPTPAMHENVILPWEMADHDEDQLKNLILSYKEAYVRLMIYCSIIKLPFHYKVRVIHWGDMRVFF